MGSKSENDINSETAYNQFKIVALYEKIVFEDMPLYILKEATYF
jgi:hypothetical protein